MKIGYYGSPEVSAQLLQRLIESEHEIVYVVSNPDKPAGRKGTPVPTPVSSLALSNKLKLYRPSSLKDSSQDLSFLKTPVDLGVVFAYGKILNQDVLNHPAHGMINLHGSLLPRLRGASPVQSAVLQGLKTSGWSVQIVELKMDTGPVLAQTETGIDPQETAGEFMERTLPQAIDLIMKVIDQMPDKLKEARLQNESEATYCTKIHTEDSMIRWDQNHLTIHNQIRGMNPAPGARTRLNGQILKIWKSIPVNSDEMPEPLPGKLLVYKEGRRKRLFASAQDGWLELLELQPQNKKQMNASDYLNGAKITDESRFEDRILE